MEKLLKTIFPISNRSNNPAESIAKATTDADSPSDNRVSQDSSQHARTGADDVQNTERNYAFDINSYDEWNGHLKRYGFVVIKSVASTSDVQTARSLFWDHFEISNKAIGLSRNDTNTWNDWHTDRRGIIVDGPTMHCEGAWFIRTLPSIATVFSRIWSTDSLIVSMDSPILWKPHPWQASIEGLHIDQNPFLCSEKNPSCVQGMVPLYDVTQESGGLEVVPGSHSPHEKEAWKLRYPSKKKSLSEFCLLRDDDPLQDKAMLVEASAGDLILWDSGTAHGGRLGTSTSPSNELIRLSQTVCMTPRSWASETVLVNRKRMFDQVIGCNHIPHQVQRTTYAAPDYVSILLTEWQQTFL